MSHKFYAVKKGNTTGIFENWDECQNAIKNYSGSEFKGFSTREEAEAYLNDKDLYLEMIKNDIKEGYVVAFTDGSYSDQTKKYGYGALILYDDKEEEICGSSNNDKYIDSRNVAGEVIAVIKVLEWCVGEGKNKVKIYHDYEGIRNWANETWKANNATSTMFTNILKNKYKDLIEYEFQHVKSHNSNLYNDRADFLAKTAATESLKKKIKSGNGWFSINNISDEELISLLDTIKNENEGIEIKDICDVNTKISKEILFGNQKIKIKLYNGQNKSLVIQGNEKTTIFQLVVSYVNEKLNKSNIIEIMSDAYNIRIDKEETEKTYSTLFNNLPSDFPDSCRRLIKQSIINAQLRIDECYDYSFLLTSCYRALEGLIKYQLEKTSIHIQKGESFRCFNKDTVTGEYYISDSRIIDSLLKTKIEKCYNFYVKHRNTDLHFGELLSLSGIDDTMIIFTFDEAKELILETLTVISENI